MKFIFILFSINLYGQTKDLPINCSNIDYALKLIDSIRVESGSDFFSQNWCNNGVSKSIVFKKNKLICISIDNYICYYREQHKNKFKLYEEGNKFDYSLNKSNKLKKFKIIENNVIIASFKVQYKGDSILFKQLSGKKVINPSTNDVIKFVKVINNSHL